MKRCANCDTEIVRLPKWSKTYYQNRQFCSLKCAAAGRVPPMRLSPLPPQPDFPTSWQDSAACVGAEPSLFYPLDDHEGSRPLNNHRIVAALSYCARCPVVAECDGFARATGSVGVWGNRYRGMNLLKGAS